MSAFCTAEIEPQLLGTRKGSSCVVTVAAYAGSKQEIVLTSSEGGLEGVQFLFGGIFETGHLREPMKMLCSYHSRIAAEKQMELWGRRFADFQRSRVDCGTVQLFCGDGLTSSSTVGNQNLL